MSKKTSEPSFLVRHRRLLLPILLLCIGSFAWPLEARESKSSDEKSATGPFAALPSPTGPIVEKIRRMPANSWLELGAPIADPFCGDAIGRSWGSKMPFAPEWRGAFLFGEGRHGARTKRNGKMYYNDDLYFYDINTHHWVCIYPGMEIGAYNLTINSDGFEVDEEGHPRPVASMVHSYAMHTYDPSRQIYWHMWSPSDYWRKSFPERAQKIKENIKIVNGLGDRVGMGRRKNASPWGYDTRKGHWTRHKTAMRAPKLGHGDHLVYLPPTKQLFFLGQTGAHLYDPTKNQWQKLNPSGPPPPRPMDAPSCYDPRRNRIYIAMGSYGNGTKVAGDENRLWAYDVATNSWIDLKPKGKTRPRQTPHPQGTNASLLHCNSKDDVVIYIARANGRGLYAYSPERNEWLFEQPKELPTNWGRRQHHGFYDPDLNVHFIFVASDSRDDGSMFAYRYGAQQKGTKQEFSSESNMRQSIR